MSRHSGSPGIRKAVEMSIKMNAQRQKRRKKGRKRPSTFESRKNLNIFLWTLKRPI